MALDGKHRLAIPARYRDVLQEHCGGHLVLTLDPSNCLSLYPFPDWEPIERKLNSLSSFNPLYARLRRSIVGNAVDVEMDSAGRILLPPLLREKARLEKDLMLVGQGNKFEIWNAAEWEAQYGSVADLPGMLEEIYQKGELPEELKGFSL